MYGRVIRAQLSIMKKKILNLNSTAEEKKDDAKLRPANFSEYVGQEKLKGQLKIYVDAAIKRKDQLDHCLFYGPPGLGKTTLAYIIANELNVNIKTASGPTFEKPADIASVLSNLEEGDVLFIDEIHRINSAVEEVLYSAMEDFYIDIVLGSEGTAHSVRLDLPKFTLVGATTMPGLLSAPLRDRFGIIAKLEYYEDSELEQIAKRTANVLNVRIDDDGAKEIGMRSRGTPRIANRLVKRIRDYAEVKYDGVITKKVADETLDELDIDKMGLDDNDRKYLQVLISNSNGKGVGIDTLAVTLGEDAGTIEEVYEPFLIMKGLIKRTKQGRVATELAYKHLDVPYQTTYLT